MNGKRKKILDAAFYVFTEIDYQQASVQQILDASQVSKGTFYKYFESKEEVLCELLRLQQLDSHIERAELENDEQTAMEILVQQTLILLHAGNKKQLSKLLFNMFASRNGNLAPIMKNEINWFAERFVTVFGEAVRPYAVEAAILFLGMLHQISNTWQGIYQLEPRWESIIPKVLHYIHGLMMIMHETQDHLLDVVMPDMMTDSEVNSQIVFENYQHMVNHFVETLQKTVETARVKDLARGLLNLLAEPVLNETMIELTFHSLITSIEDFTNKREAKRLHYLLPQLTQ